MSEREELAKWLLQHDVGPFGAEAAVKLTRIADLLLQPPAMVQVTGEMAVAFLNAWGRPTTQYDIIRARRALEAALHAGMPSGYEVCTFGPLAERKAKYILRFEDDEVGDMYFDDYDEAVKTFQSSTLNWNCTLYGTVLLPAAPAPGEGR